MFHQKRRRLQDEEEEEEEVDNNKQHLELTTFNEYVIIIWSSS